MTNRFFAHFVFPAQTTEPDAQPGAATPLGIYLHWPWCLKKCPYCDFNSHTAVGGINAAVTADYAARLRQELTDWRQRTGPRHVTSLFFGGGTPTLMGATEIGRLIEHVETLYGIPRETEITVESNPTSGGTVLYQDLRLAGVNRLSVGVQALEDQDLRFLGREHDAADARQTLAQAQQVFTNVNVDLMYGLPGQNRQKWAKNLTEIAQRGLAHVSAYQLTIEANTAFYGAVRRGQWQPVDTDVEADFYQETGQVLAEQGYINYEVSNHARAGYACRHNLAVWQYEDYLGVGAGAHGRVRLKDGQRLASRVHRSPNGYLGLLTAAATEKNPQQRQSQQLVLPMKTRLVAGWEALQEAFMLGLRLREGIDVGKLSLNLPIATDWESALDYDGFVTLLGEGLLEICDTRLRASEHGSWHLDRLLCDLLR